MNWSKIYVFLRKEFENHKKKEGKKKFFVKNYGSHAYYNLINYYIT